MTPLTIIKGDATSPQAKGHKAIAHVYNDLGDWGKGLVLAISRRWQNQSVTSVADINGGGRRSRRIPDRRGRTAQGRHRRTHRRPQTGQRMTRA